MGLLSQLWQMRPASSAQGLGWALNGESPDDVWAPRHAKLLRGAVRGRRRPCGDPALASSPTAVSLCGAYGMQLAVKLGMADPHLVIIGGGRAGLSAGCHALRSGFQTTIV